jgi:hypothetical protein
MKTCVVSDIEHVGVIELPVLSLVLSDPGAVSAEHGIRPEHGWVVRSTATEVSSADTGRLHTAQSDWSEAFRAPIGAGILV